MKKTILSLGLCLLAAQSVNAQVTPLLNQSSTDLSQNEGIALWKSMKDSFTKKSECYNRAQTWTYDANRKFGYEAKKILIHYSLKYNECST